MNSVRKSDSESGRGKGVSLSCDACRLPIKTASEGWLEWIISDKGSGYGFRVCHKEPIGEGRKSCQAYSNVPGPRGVHLLALVGDQGIKEMVDILIQYGSNRVSWGRMFLRLLEGGLFMEV